MGHRCSRGCLGSMIFQCCIDQGYPHIMNCQIEPLLTQDKIKGIILLISRSILTDEQNHIIPDANQLLDCVGLEIDDGSIRFFILLKVPIITKLYGIPCDHKVSVIKDSLADDPFLDPLSYQVIGDFPGMEWFQGFLVLGGAEAA